MPSFKFWRSRPELEVDEELASHIELLTRRYLEQGMSELEARARAHERFGERDGVRAQCTTISQRMEARVRRAEYLEELAQDLKFALRTLRKSRLFTVVALSTIAIGVGANTAIFSVIDAVLLEAPPYANASRLMVLFNSYEQEGLSKTPLSAPEFFDVRATMHSFDAIAAMRPRPATVVGNGGPPEGLSAYVVTPNFFQVLGANAAYGRTFRDGDGIANGASLVVLSHALWTRRYGADTSLIGKAITINAAPYTVIGVMPPGLRFPDDALGYAKSPADIWIPSTYDAQNTPPNRGNQNLIAMGRRKPGATDANIRTDLGLVSARFKRELPDRYASLRAKNWHPIAVTLQDETVGAVKPVLLLFGGAVAFVLLIACMNVANLLIDRGSLRTREFAVRLALGAGRARLLRQLLTESLVLTTFGGVLGVAVAKILVVVLTRLQPGDIPRLSSATVNGSVLLFALGVSIITGLLIGLLPALQQSRTGLAGAMNESSRGASDGKSRRHTRAILVGVEVALALVLLNGAGLLGRSFAALQNIEPGFSAPSAMTMYTSLPRTRYDSAYKIANFYEQLQNNLATIPGATKVGGIYPLPMSGEGWSGSFDIEGVPENPMEGPHAEFAAAMPGYFGAIGIPIVQGRDFTAEDKIGRELVVIVDEELARKYWLNENAIGKRVNAAAAPGVFETVVGVVKHVRTEKPEAFGGPQIYLPYMQHPQGMIYSVVRTSVSPNTLARALRGAVELLDKDLPVSKLQSMTEVQLKIVARQRFNMLMIGMLAVVALVLASVGLYGVMSYLVTQRAREIGIRMALGGQASDVRWLVVRESLWISLGGLAGGTIATLALSGVLGKMLYEVKATDPATYASIAVLLLSVASVAAYGPARRATRVAPLEVLRDG
ncbi:MAG: ABC transporter permease [Gemmatimonas sp.]